VLLVYGLPDGYGQILPTRFQSYQIPSESMVPSLLVGDRLVADGWAYWGHDKNPKRGEIVVFDYPRDHSVKYVKRVIGVPGDTVELRQGELYLNGRPVPQQRTSAGARRTADGWEQTEFLETLDNTSHPIYRTQPMAHTDFGPVTVPEGNYFVMGDNRDRSSDSRVWGYVKREEILARMQYIYFSRDQESGGIRWDRLGLQVR
jgi:signal peptidase I